MVRKLEQKVNETSIGKHKINFSGDVALEKRLTELLEATTGLVGKSVFLELKFTQPKEAKFLGDWFGPGNDDIVIQAFLQVNNDKANIKTSKFIKLPANCTQVEMNITMSRDLKDESISLPCKLKEVLFVQPDQVRN